MHLDLTKIALKLFFSGYRYLFIRITIPSCNYSSPEKVAITFILSTLIRLRNILLS